ncbi:MAG TPA: tetratricopeptide repeat protein, partial [Allocoleopsis sp.]
MINLSQDSSWKETAFGYLENQQYSKAAELYEQAIELDPEGDLQHYWWLGLLQLLQGQEADAQATWFCGLSTAEDIDLVTLDLINLLETEASRQEAQEDIQAAWLIRQHIREIAPHIGRNLLKLIPLSVQQRTLTEDSPELEQLINLLESKTLERVEAQLLFDALESILDFMPLAGSTLKFAEACIPFMEPSSFTNTLMMAAMKIAYKQKQPTHASRVAELCLKVEPDNIEVLRILAAFYQNSGQYDLGIQTARRCCDLVEKIEDKAFASHLLLRGILSAGGYWDEVQTAIQKHKQLLNQLIEERPLNLHPITVERLFSTTYFLPYCEDSPVENRRFHNEVAKLCQANIAIYATEQVAKYKQSQALHLATTTSERQLKIGYISHCLNRHSVGWLARWLFHYHSPEQITTYGYFVNFSDAVEDSLRDWYLDNINHVRKTSSSATEIADQINEDHIDILVDLDSLTLDITCEVMSLKPAPIQVSWLGWDASGIPSIDYFLAD